ncbi:MAG: hypothetical protein WCP73_05170, partial [Eubacteriales bacterium]
MVNIKQASLRNVVKNSYVVGIMVLFLAVFEILSPTFLAGASVANIIRSAGPTVIVAVAATLLMISGNIDLSVGSILGFSGVLYAMLSKNGVPMLLGLIITLGAGLLIGILNGFLVVRLKITPVIATLATMNVFLGIAKLMCGTTIP